MDTTLNSIVNLITTAGIKILIALVILVVSFKLINWLDKKYSHKLIESGTMDKTIAKTVLHAVRIALKGLIIIALIGYLGIETGALSAVIGSLGVCIGLAVNGTLSNLAGGIMIMITHPFRIDDYINAQGTEGTVEEITITYTKLVTPDNKTVYLPNSALSAGSIINVTEKGTRRMDMEFLVTGNDPGKVRKLLLSVCKEDSRIFDSPEPFARITDYGNGGGLKVTLRAWCASSNYWDIYFDVIDRVKEVFDENDIIIPVAKMDIRMVDSGK